MHFYSKNHFQCIFMVKIISYAFLWWKLFPMHFYGENHFQCIFMVKIISNAFL